MEDIWNIIDCEINLQLNWSSKCTLVAGTAANQVPTFTITDTKLYVPVATWPTPDYCEKLIAIDLSKQQKLDAGPKAIKQINFSRNLSRSKKQF